MPPATRSPGVEAGKGTAMPTPHLFRLCMTLLAAPSEFCWAAVLSLGRWAGRSLHTAAGTVRNAGGRVGACV